mgnify:CR=1 FL=1
MVSDRASIITAPGSMTPEEAAEYHSPQIAAMAEAGVDLVQAMTFGQTVDQLAHDVIYIHPALSEVVEQVRGLIDLGLRLAGDMKRDRLAEKLESFNWVFIPYARPGLPLAMAIARRIKPAHDRLHRRKPRFNELVPWFIIGFLVVLAVRSVGLIPQSVVPAITSVPSPRATTSVPIVGAWLRRYTIIASSAPMRSAACRCTGSRGFNWRNTDPK